MVTSEVKSVWSSTEASDCCWLVENNQVPQTGGSIHWQEPALGPYRTRWWCPGDSEAGWSTWRSGPEWTGPPPVGTEPGCWRNLIGQDTFTPLLWSEVVQTFLGPEPAGFCSHHVLLWLLGSLGPRLHLVISSCFCTANTPQVRTCKGCNVILHGNNKYDTRPCFKEK